MKKSVGGCQSTVVSGQKLLPCPFCESYDVKAVQNKALNGMTFIECDHCGCVVSFRANEEKQDTIAMWNGRNSYTENEEIRYQKGLKRWANVPEDYR